MKFSVRKRRVNARDELLDEPGAAPLRPSSAPTNTRDGCSVRPGVRFEHTQIDAVMNHPSNEAIRPARVVAHADCGLRPCGHQLLQNTPDCSSRRPIAVADRASSSALPCMTLMTGLPSRQQQAVAVRDDNIEPAVVHTQRHEVAAVPEHRPFANPTRGHLAKRQNAHRITAIRRPVIVRVHHDVVAAIDESVGQVVAA